MGPGAIILGFKCWGLSKLFHAFTFINQELFTFSSLSAITVVSSTYLRLLIFLQAILIPACESSRQHFIWCTLHKVHEASLVAQLVKYPPAMQETWDWSLVWENTLEKGMANHYSILAWRISCTIQSMGSQRADTTEWLSPLHHSASELNKQGDIRQPWHTLFPILNQCAAPCPVLTVASWLAYRFLRRQVRQSGIPISLRIFQFLVIHTVKGFSIVNEAEVLVFFLELSCFFYDPIYVASLISGSSAFSKSSLFSWKF